MKLTLKDRIIILKTVLPEYDTKVNIEIKRGIVNKIGLTSNEEKEVIIQDLGNGQMHIGFSSASATTDFKEFELNALEIDYLKNRVNNLDNSAMFSEFTYDTYSKILEESTVSLQNNMQNDKE